MKTKIISSIVYCLLILGISMPGPAFAGGVRGAQKLEGAWIARVDGFPGQWSYVSSADSSGRRASVHGSIDVGFSVQELGSYDEVTPFVGASEMTGPKTAVGNAIWYGLKELAPPSIPSHEVVWIGTTESAFEFKAANKMFVVHNFAFYLADQDGNGDGLPDAGETPVYTLQLTTNDTRVPSP